MADDVVAYVGASVETLGPAGRIESGTVVVRDGKIDAVGETAQLPVNARVVDVRGQTIMPALVDVYHPISVGGSDGSAGVRIVQFRGRTFRLPTSAASNAGPFQKVADNLDLRSLEDDMRDQSRLGVARFQAVTRGYGQGAQISVRPDDASAAMAQSDGLLYLAVSNNTTSLDVLRKGLAESSESSRSRRSRSPGRENESAQSGPGADRQPPASQSDRGGSRRGGRSGSSDPADALWEAVRSGDSPLLVNVSNASTILYVMDILDKYDDVRLVLVARPSDVFQTLDRLKRRNVTVITEGALTTAPRSRDRINVAKMLADAGIAVGFSPSLDSSLSSMPDSPLFPVALLVRTGLSRDAALRALTLVPAQVLGIESSVGTVEQGKQANLLFFDGDPLDAAGRIRSVLVEGRPVYED